MLIDDEVEPDLVIGVGESKSAEPVAVADESCANIGCAARTVQSRDRVEGSIVYLRIQSTNDSFTLSQGREPLVKLLLHKAAGGCWGDRAAFCVVVSRATKIGDDNDG